LRPRILATASVGRPQFIAGGLLLLYLLQCAWLVHVHTLHGALPDSDHALRAYLGLQQWRGGAIAGTPDSLRAENATELPSAARGGHLRVLHGYDRDRSPLYYLTSGAPLLVAPAALPAGSTLGQLWAAAPGFFFGVMLGGSLWYVARRLYGNGGGYVALALYCFSPSMIVNTAGAPSQGEMGAVWGAFGLVFTAIAVAHTLYAPREVVLWNWRRILLLGLSMLLAVGNQFSFAILILVALALMFWVAPIRKGAALTIWMTALLFAALLLFAAYFGDSGLLHGGLRHAAWVNFERDAFRMPFSWSQAARTLGGGAPPLLVLFPAALLAWTGWKRARYFGNTAPLLITVLLVALTIAAADFPGQGFYLVTTIFAFVFVAGVSADLMESRWGAFATPAIAGLLSASALWNVVRVARAALQ
jgi:hypothetical protein